MCNGVFFIVAHIVLHIVYDPGGVYVSVSYNLSVAHTYPAAYSC